MEKLCFDKDYLNVELMDKHHVEFMELYNHIDTDDNKKFIKAMKKILKQTKRHFADEERIMDEINYKRIIEHKEEHRRILYELGYFLEASHSLFGLKLLKSYAKEKIPFWFDHHLKTMDSDLAQAIKKHQPLS